MYVVEYLPRLQQISVKLEFPEHAKLIKGIGIRLATLVVQAQSTYLVLLPVPDTNLQLGKIAGLTVKDGIMSLTITVDTSPSVQDSFMSLSGSDNQKWSVKDLVTKTPRNSDNVNEFAFCCSNCGANIINSADMKFMDMPSEFWHELMDFWHCHKPHEHHHNETEKNYNGKLLPNSGSVHIGSSYLLMHGNHATCPHCGAILGSTEGTCTRLSKWKLKLKYGSVIESFPPYAFVFYSLLDKVNASAVRKVSVQSGLCKLTVWVSNLGLDVSFTGSSVLTNAFKILFCKSEKLEDEVLEVPKEVYDSFRTRIEYINTKLPLEYATMTMSENGTSQLYRVSYLLSE